MSTIVQLPKIIDAISMQTEGIAAFFNRKTGETALVEEDLLVALQEDFNEEDDLGWDKELIAEAKQVLTTEDWLELPSTYDFHEWQVMKEFALSVTQDSARENLLQALSGKGAFRYFKDTLNRWELTEQWYQWRDKAIEELAVAWLKENNLD
jgi:hypothetical protein